MDYPKYRNMHRPHHDSVCIPGVYFVTGSVIDHENTLHSDNTKDILFEIMINKCEQFELGLISWVICDNHYHILISSDKEFNISSFINRVHSVSAMLINRNDNQVGRHIWYQYWDRRIRDETDFWRHINYCHYNPVKHGLAGDIKDLGSYEYCSFHVWEKVFGIDALESFFEFYPISDFDPFAR